LASEYRKNGELDQAIALCEQHLGEQPGNMNGQVVYGQALFDSGRYEQAEATFTTALTLDPQNLIALRHLGDIARLNGNSGGALEWYNRVLEADPRNDEIQGFIEELKTAAAAAPPPPAREPTPIATPAVPTPAAGTDGAPPPRATKPSAPVTLEIDAQAVAARSAPTPIAPIPPVAPPPRASEPKKRVSLGLIDLDISMATDAAAAADAPPPAPEAPASIPSGDIDLGSVDFGDMPAAPDAPSGQPMSLDSISMPPMDAPAPAEGFEAGEFVPPAESIAAAEGLEPTDALGWDMGGTVDLDAPAAAPIVEGESAPRPQVFVTETMAELYLQQGFRDEALKVYKQLAEQNPDDASLRERIAALEGGGRASMSFEKLATEEPELAPGTDALVPMPGESTPAAAPEVPVEALDFDMSTSIPAPDGSIVAAAPESTDNLLDLGEPVTAPAAIPPRAPTPAAAAPVAPRAPTPSGQSARAFFASLAQRKALRPDGTLPKGMDAVPAAPPPAVQQGGGSVDVLFTSGPSPEDEAIGLALMTAVGLVESSTPIRGRPTQAAGSELSLDSVFRSESPMRTSGPVKRQSQLLKFDQFFSADQPAGESTDTQAASDAGPAAPADDAQFQAWLTQLKNQ
jgi:tetratricopeptide (TPR) repeat protein